MGFEHATRASKGARNYQEDASAVPGGLRTADGGSGRRHGRPRRRRARQRPRLQVFPARLRDLVRRGSARLAEALELANAAIAHETAGNPALNGMGCTLIGAAFGPEGVEWVSVGDSPLFLVRNGEIVRPERGPLAGTRDRQAGRRRQDQLGGRARPIRAAIFCARR